MNVRNNVTLIGHLGMDPEVKEMENGSVFAKFRLATNETYKNKNGDRVTQTQWHNCIAWGKAAEVMGEHFTKGKEVVVNGKLTYRTYDDSTGVRRTVSEIVVRDFSFVGKKEVKDSEQAPQAA